jgi:hypothetical protein
MEDKGQMRVSEPVATYTPTAFDTVISYLHSSHMPMETKRAVYLQLQAEVADENLGYMKRRLKEFADLQPGWDGEDALPVLPEIAKFMGQLLRSCNSLELADWSLFPNVNGTFLLQRKNAAISIGQNEYSYFAEAKDTVMGHDHQSLSIESVRKTIETINRYA